MGGAVISWCLAAAGLCLAVVFGAADAVAQDDREHALVLKMGPAIYTRKSTEYNLELAFNSLDAQREACEAYIKNRSVPRPAANAGRRAAARQASTAWSAFVT